MAKGKKPAKPYPEFPLFAHNTGRWAKKIHGKFHYFGPWNDWQAALEKYQRQRDDLFAGRVPQDSPDGPTVQTLINAFINSKMRLVQSGELTSRTFAELYRSCERVGEVFGGQRSVTGLRAHDFESLRERLARGRGYVSLGNQIQRVRSLFKYAYDTRMIDRPVVFGPLFSKPSKRLMRQERYAKGPRMFEAGQIREILAKANVTFRAMILLGVNCGFGNSDCASLPRSALDLDGKWVNFPRPKTSMPRRCPLWAETVDAIRAVLSQPRSPCNREHANLVFLTRFGAPWYKGSPLRKDERGRILSPSVDGAICRQFNRFVRAAGIELRGVGFYGLRHTFETIGGEAGDQIAVSAIMGHVDASMAAVYRERISDARLLAVTDHIRDWLFAELERAEEVNFASG